MILSPNLIIQGTAVTVQFTSGESGKGMIDVVNVAGQIQLQKSMAVSAGTNQTAVDIQRLSPGVYYFRTYVRGAGTKTATLCILRRSVN